MIWKYNLLIKEVDNKKVIQHTLKTATSNIKLPHFQQDDNTDTDNEKPQKQLVEHDKNDMSTASIKN